MFVLCVIQNRKSASVVSQACDFSICSENQQKHVFLVHWKFKTSFLQLSIPINHMNLH